jgi:Ca-activated chloride channel family protein
MAEVRPMSITFVIDTSASMTFERMRRAQSAIRAIAHQLRRGDLVSATNWNTGSTTLLDGITVTGPDDPRVLAMAADLRATWEDTDFARGLRAGYALALRHRAVGRLNRVVLISDGEANVGPTDADTIARPARDEINGEVHLVGVSVGNGIDDTLMDRVTDLGRGASVFIDRPEESSVVFGSRFVETMDVAVRAVRIELELPWYMRLVATTAESVATEPTLVEPQYLSPNDAMVFQQSLHACSATVARPSDAITVRATFRDRDTSAPRDVLVRTTVGALSIAPEAALRKGAAVAAYAEAIKIADLGDRATALAAIERAQRAVARARALGDDADLIEIAALLTRYHAVRRLL